MKKENGKQPGFERETADLTPEEKHEAQTVLTRLADILEKPEVEAYLNAVLGAPIRLILGGMDKLALTERLQKAFNLKEHSPDPGSQSKK